MAITCTSLTGPRHLDLLVLLAAGAQANDALVARHQEQREQLGHFDAAAPLHHHRARGRPHGEGHDQVSSTYALSVFSTCALNNVSLVLR